MSNLKYWARVSTHIRIGMGSFHLYPRINWYYIQEDEGDNEVDAMFCIAWLWFEAKAVGGRDPYSPLLQEHK